jgi:SHAQKYF class myb-like DNA-binding protein
LQKDLKYANELHAKKMLELRGQIRVLKDERQLNLRTIWTLQDHDEEAWGETLEEGMGKLEMEEVVGYMSLETKNLTISNYKQFHGCMQCRYNECPWVLHLHHKDVKGFTVSSGLDSHPWDEVVAETRKCVVYCSRCHTVWHYNQHLARVAKRTRFGGWTADEKTKFLEGLLVFGKRKWQKVAEEFVFTRTGEQVKTHARMYYIELKRKMVVYARKSGDTGRGRSPHVASQRGVTGPGVRTFQTCYDADGLIVE